MSITIRTLPDESHVVIGIRGSFSFEQDEAFTAALEAISARMRRTTIDLTQTVSLDASALALLIQARDKVKSPILRFRLLDDSLVKETLEIANFCGLFDCELVQAAD